MDNRKFIEITFPRNLYKVLYLNQKQYAFIADPDIGLADNLEIYFETKLQNLKYVPIFYWLPTVRK